MKNAAWISFAVVLALMPVYASASAGVDLLLDTNQAKLCSGSTAQITGTLTSDAAGTYAIKAGSKWATIAPDVVTLGAGERKEVYVYITPDFVSAPNDYSIEITAESGAGIKNSKEIITTILPCHNIALNAIPSKAGACLDEVAHFSINLTNNGKFFEDFIILATDGILEAGKITLEAGETKTVGLDVPAKDTKKEVAITAKSTSTYASESKTVEVNGINCYSSNLAIAPEEKSACLYDGANYTLTLKNTGTRPDIFRLNSTFGTLSQKEISINAGESKTISLAVASDVVGDYDFDITAISQRSRADAKGLFTAVQCRGVEAKIAPGEQTICKGFPVNYSIDVENTGSVDDVYLITSGLGAFQKENVSVPKKSSAKVLLSIPADTLEDKNFINIKATSVGDSKITALGSAALYTENCYIVDSSADLAENKICAGKTAVFGIELTNAGKLADEYEITATSGNLSKSNVSLAAGEKTGISLGVPTEINDSGKLEIIVEARSKNTNTTQKLSLEIEPAEDCYGFKVVAKTDTLVANGSAGNLFEINIANNGRDAGNYSANLDGPVWSYLSPRSFMVMNGKNVSIYVYAAPAFGTKDGAYLMKIDVTNNDIGLTKTEHIQLVVGNATPLDLGGFNSISGKITESATSKPLYVIALGIIAIALIIFGPGLFSKKDESKGSNEKEPEIAAVEEGLKGEAAMKKAEDIMSEIKELSKSAKEELSAIEKTPEAVEEKSEPAEDKKTKKPAKKRGRPSKKELSDILDNV